MMGAKLGRKRKYRNGFLSFFALNALISDLNQLRNLSKV